MTTDANEPEAHVRIIEAHWALHDEALAATGDLELLDEEHVLRHRVDMRTETDCLRCCLATVLGLPYEDVPDFVAEARSLRWTDDMAAWLENRGFGLVRVQATGDGELLHSVICAQASPWIASGPSARGRNHAAVYIGPDMIHDPHPSRAGIESITAATVIVRRPARQSSLVDFRLKRLAALRSEKQHDLRSENGISACEICARPINTERETGFWSDSEGAYFHDACWSGGEDDIGLEPDDDDCLVDEDTTVRLRLEPVGEDGEPANVAPTSGFDALLEQVRRLRTMVCATMEFGVDRDGLVRAMHKELRELQSAQGDDQHDEAGDVLAVAVNLALDTGDIDDILQRVTTKLRGRLDHMASGGSWSTAKKAERTSCPSGEEPRLGNPSNEEW